jgi:hypothetical protein
MHPRRGTSQESVGAACSFSDVALRPAHPVRRVKRRNGTWQEMPEVRRPVSAGEINRELTVLKRMFSLAIEAAKLHHKPHFDMLREDNVRVGFFERAQYVAVLAHLEARLVVSDQGRVLHGLLGAYAVGVVNCRNGQAAFGDEVRGRVIIFGSGQKPPAAVAISPGLVYEPRSAADQDPEAPLRELHREMRVVEEQFAR